MRCLLYILTLVAIAGGPTAAVAGHPLLTFWARQPTGPYQPQTGRYVVVDPTPVAPPHMDHHGSPMVAGTEYWQRRDLTPHTYPYGWFGAAPHATNNWRHTYYYDNYTDNRILRGR